MDCRIVVAAARNARARLFLTDDGLLPHGATVDAASRLLLTDGRQGRRKLVSVRPLR